MKPIDITGPHGVAMRATAPSATPVSGVEPVRPARLASPQTETPGLSLAAAGDSAPIDAERVATIRKALEDGRYPVIPMRVSDAMIAAGLLLRVK